MPGCQFPFICARGSVSLCLCVLAVGSGTYGGKLHQRCHPPRQRATRAAWPTCRQPAQQFSTKRARKPSVHLASAAIPTRPEPAPSLARPSTNSGLVPQLWVLGLGWVRTFAGGPIWTSREREPCRTHHNRPLECSFEGWWALTDWWALTGRMPVLLAADDTDAWGSGGGN
jgi:hypothetical protein